MAKTSARLQSFGERISRTQRLWLMTAGVVLITGGIAFYGIYSPWQKKKTQLESDYALQVKRLDLLSEISLKKQKIEKQEEKLLLSGGASALTDRISRLADKAGVQIESVTPQSQVSLGLYSESPIQVIATATFSQLVEFLRLLEKNESLLKIDRLELTKGTGQQPPPRVYSQTFGRQKNTPSVSNEMAKLKVKLLVGSFSESGATS